MYKLFLVARHEYTQRATQKSFLLGTLVMPLLFAVLIAVAVFIFAIQRSDLPFGYVDYSGLLTDEIQPEDAYVKIIEFPDEISARSAMQSGEIQGYHVVPSDYLQNLEVNLYYLDKRPAEDILVDFDDFVRVNLAAQPTPVEARLMEGFNLSIRSVDGSRQMDAGYGFISVLFPFFLAMFFFFATMGTSGYFLQAITDEKENRTMEIMVTAVSPIELIGGKTLALFGVALTQLGIWVLTILVGWLVAVRLIPELSVVVLPWDILLMALAFFIPSFALVAGLTITIGVSVTELQEAQQTAGIVNLLFTFPMFLSTLVFANADNPILVAFSLFPTTSFIMITLRWGFTIIPLWQLLTAWAILVITALLSIWMAVSVFRFGMLSYGQKLSWKTIWNLTRRNIPGKALPPQGLS